MKNVRWLLLLSCPLLLASCGDKLGRGVDGRSFLDKLAGPKVDSVDDALLASAKAAEAEGNTKKALQYYQQLAEKYPSRTEYKISVADGLRRTGDVNGAQALYEALLKDEPGLPAALEGKGLCLLQKGDALSAAPVLTQARATGQVSWRTPNALGIIAAAQSQPTEAGTYFTEALRASPNNPSILNNIGLAQALNRNFDASLATFAQASIAAKPDTPMHQQIDLNNALAYAAAGKLDEAEALTRKYYNGAALNNNMALYAHLAQDDQLAKTYLNMALTQSKTFYQRAWNNLEMLNAAGTRPSAEAKTLTLGAAPAPSLEIAKPAEPSAALAIAAPVETPKPAETAQPSKMVSFTPVPAEKEPAPATAGMLSLLGGTTLPAANAPSDPAPMKAETAKVESSGEKEKEQEKDSTAVALVPMQPQPSPSTPESPAAAQAAVLVAPAPAEPEKDTATVFPPSPSTLPPAQGLLIPPGYETRPALPAPTTEPQLAPASGATPSAPVVAAPVPPAAPAVSKEKDSENGFESLGNWMGSLLD